MAEINQIRRCYNCGAILQSDDPSLEGYVKKETLENAKQNFLFCDKCFEIERFKARLNEPVLDPDFLCMLEDAKKKNALIVYVVNLYSFEAAFNHQINNIIQRMNILVVGNKFDLLPAGTSKDDLQEYVAHRFRAVGLTICADNVVIASAFEDDMAREVLTRIYELKNGKDVFIVGSALSGKTTLVSSFLRVVNNLSKGNIETAPYPGTNLNVMQIPMSKRSKMYDTPGISIDNSILYKLDKETNKEIYVTKPLKVREVSIAPGQSLFIGGLAFIQLVSGKQTTFSCYFHDHVQLKKTILSNKSPDEKFVSLVLKKALKPSLPTITSVKDLDVYEIVVTESNQRDLGILGLGWLSFMANKQVIRIYLPSGVSFFHSRSKLIKKK